MYPYSGQIYNIGPTVNPQIGVGSKPGPELGHIGVLSYQLRVFTEFADEDDNVGDMDCMPVTIRMLRPVQTIAHCECKTV